MDWAPRALYYRIDGSQESATIVLFRAASARRRLFCSKRGFETIENPEVDEMSLELGAAEAERSELGAVGAGARKIVDLPDYCVFWHHPVPFKTFIVSPASIPPASFSPILPSASPT